MAVGINWGLASRGLSTLEQRINQARQAQSAARLRMADIHANATRQRGQIWGSAVNQVAQIAANTVTQHAQMNEAAMAQGQAAGQQAVNEYMKTPKQMKVEQAQASLEQKAWTKDELFNVKSEMATLEAQKQKGLISQKKFQKKMEAVQKRNTELQQLQSAFTQATKGVATYTDGTRSWSKANSEDNLKFLEGLSVGAIGTEWDEEAGTYVMTGEYGGRDFSGLTVGQAATLDGIIPQTENMASLTKDTLASINKITEFENENGDLMQGVDFNSDVNQQRLKNGLNALKNEIGITGMKDRLATEGVDIVNVPPEGVNPEQWAKLPMAQKLSYLEKTRDNGETELSKRFNTLAVRTVHDAYNTSQKTVRSAAQREGDLLSNQYKRGQIANQAQQRELNDIRIKNEAAKNAGLSKNEAAMKIEDTRQAYIKAEQSGDMKLLKGKLLPDGSRFMDVRPVKNKYGEMTYELQTKDKNGATKIHVLNAGDEAGARREFFAIMRGQLFGTNETTNPVQGPSLGTVQSLIAKYRP